MGKYAGKNALTAFWNGIKAMFSDVAFSGDYDDLDNKPSVETAASGGTTESLVTTGEKYDWNEKYEKPSGGIPKTDLESAVQTSLGLADTAIQSHQDLSTILGDFATMEASITASQAYAVGDFLIFNQVLYKVITAISSGGTIVTSGVSANVEQTDVGTEVKNGTLWYSNQAIASTSGSSGTLATITDARITADHVLTECVWANPSNITSDVSWITSAGALVLNGKSSATTTATITLVKKDN